MTSNPSAYIISSFPCSLFDLGIGEPSFPKGNNLRTKKNFAHCELDLELENKTKYLHEIRRFMTLIFDTSSLHLWLPFCVCASCFVCLFYVYVCLFVCLFVLLRNR